MKDRNITILKNVSNRDAIVFALNVAQIEEYAIKVKDKDNYSVAFKCEDDTLFGLGVFFEQQRKRIEDYEINQIPVKK